MSLYLCVLDDEEDELGSVDVGRYGYLESIQALVTEHLENGLAGCKYPKFVLHDPTDGEWSSPECRILYQELEEIGDAFRELPPFEYSNDEAWKIENIRGSLPENLYECLEDVEGNPLLERLQLLCDVAVEHDRPILFQ